MTPVDLIRVTYHEEPHRPLRRGGRLLRPPRRPPAEARPETSARSTPDRARSACSDQILELRPSTSANRRALTGSVNPPPPSPTPALSWRVSRHQQLSAAPHDRAAGSSSRCPSHRYGWTISPPRRRWEAARTRPEQLDARRPAPMASVISALAVPALGSADRRSPTSPDRRQMRSPAVEPGPDLLNRGAGRLPIDDVVLVVLGGGGAGMVGQDA
jgi:hypothetical protein